MEKDAKLESPKNMRSIFLAIIFAILIIVGIGGYFLYGKNVPNLNKTVNIHNQTNNSSNSSGNKMKFKNSPLWQSAVKIFPGPLSAKAKTALTGFDLQTKNLPGGSTQVTLFAKQLGYKTQNFIVKKGYSVYFVESLTSDDSQNENSDTLMVDDTAFLIDPNGFIAQ